MAQLRVLKRRIKSVRNTIKITRTMELVATARAKQNQDRLAGAKPYFETLATISREVGGGEGSGGDGPAHPLLEQREAERRVCLLALTADRGFCGGYNSNVLALGRARRAAEEAAGRKFDLYLVGRKGVSGSRFRGETWSESWTGMGDRPSFDQVVTIGDLLAQRFLTGELDRVDVAYWHYVSSGKQEQVVETLLPIQGSPGEGDAGEAAAADFIVDPEPERIVQWIFPLWYRTNLYRMFLEAAASEQLARRSAMKAATDNANEMADSLNIQYNRARQAQITTEILEVMGGAEALK